MNSPFDDENSLEENKSERLKTIRVDYEDQRYHEIPFDFFENRTEGKVIRSARSDSGSQPKRKLKLILSPFEDQDLPDQYRPNYIDSPRPKRNKFSKKHLWILSRLEEMGLQANHNMIKRTIQSYPEETPNDYLVDAIVQQIMENDGGGSDGSRDSDLQADSDFSGSDERSDKYERLLHSFNMFLAEGTLPIRNRQASAAREHCCLCFRSKEDNSSVFNCAHPFCRTCILARFKQRIDNNEDIERFQCCEFDCNANVNVEKFVALIPEAEQKPLENNELGMCNICFEPAKGSEDFLKIFTCNTHFFCYDCTLANLKEYINNRKVLEIRCPDSECDAELNEEKLKDFLPTHLHKKFHRFKRNALIERNPNTRWCSRPGCEKVVEGTKESPKANCECGQTTCVLCGNVWHENKTCEEAMDEEYKTFAKQRDLQYCPECKSRVEKMTGCNHMTCPICTYEWCWLCGGEYSQGHFDPLNPLGCPGLMSGNNTRKNWSKCKIIAYRFAMMLVLLIVIGLSPIWIVIGAALFPNLVYEHNAYDSNCKKFSVRGLLLIAGIISIPLTIALGSIAAIVPGTCIFGKYLIKRYRERSNAKKRRRQLIKSREEKIVKGESLNPNVREDEINRNNLTIDWLSRGLLTRPLLHEEERLPQPRGDHSIDLE